MNYFSKTIIIFFLVLLSLESNHPSFAESSSEYWDRDFQKNQTSIKTVTGKLYAFIVLLYNENPHFINLIQEDSISPEMMQIDGFNIREYRNYLDTIKNANIKKIADVMYNIYIHPEKHDLKALQAVQDNLAKLDIILRFSRNKNTNEVKIILDYCIYGRKEPVNIVHPLFNITENIFNIQPYIYYDEFSTSNSTFYFDMIYINPDEVNNDYLIAQNIINNRDVEHMFFVGARVNDNIKYCITNAFSRTKDIKKEILDGFIIHEITHKTLNNRYNNIDQVTGEELALLSMIYYNPFYGLSILYSYLDYNQINPHRIASMNIIRYIANKTGKQELIEDPSDIKIIDAAVLKKLVREYFFLQLKKIK